MTIYPPKNENAWMGESAVSLYRHKDDVRCEFYMGPWTNVRIALTWDSVTCPDCLALKKDWEPETVTIDTKGD
jgi:hypothetical protein